MTPGRLRSASQQYVRTHQQTASDSSLANAIAHIRAALDLREVIVWEGAMEGLTQCGFVVYKAVLRFGSGIVIWFRDVLNI